MDEHVVDPDSSPATSTAPPPLWRNRDFRLLWSGQVVSNAGSNMSAIAFPLLVLALTHSAFQAGLVGAVQGLPFLLLTLPAGALVDRWERKRTMIVCDLVRMAAFGLIPLAAWTGHLGLAVIYLTVTIEGTAFTLFNLAELSAMTRIVPREQLPAATAQYQIVFALAGIVGPPIAGVLYGVRRALPFLADAVSYAVSAVSLAFIRTPLQEERIHAPQHLRHEVAEGIGWLWRRPLLRFMALITGGLNVAFAGSALIFIVLLRRDLNADPRTIGLVFGFAAIGAIGGAFVGTWIQRRTTFGQAIVGGLWVQTVLWLLFLPMGSVAGVGILAFLFFVTVPLYDIVQFSYRVALIPDALQGRVNSIFRLVAQGGVPVGQLAAGGLVQWLGPRGTIGVVGVALAALALACTISPHVRHAPPVEEARALIEAETAERAVT